ncbi:hypothetical protein GC173_15905 [bacterium]|nr:hypothetical protein [bacterium]
MKASILHINKLNTAMAVRYAGGITDELSVSEAIPTLAPPRWQFGHLVVVAHLGGTLVGGTAFLPDSWREMFGGGTRLNPEVNYPSMAEIVDNLQRAHQMAADALSAASDDLLISQTSLERLRPRFPQTGDAVAFLLGTHVGYHLGEVMAWRKAAGLGVPPA